jgi:plasmid stabilization system protein ParE
MGRSRDEDLRPGLRSFPVGEYIIIYRIEDDDVVILHVVIGGRNIQAPFTIRKPAQAQAVEDSWTVPCAK